MKFALTPTSPSIIDYTAAIKHIHDALSENTPTIETECGKYYSNVKNVLANYSKKSILPKFNISKDERGALCSLRNTSNCMVLTADKGVALVVMDKHIYDPS